LYLILITVVRVIGKRFGFSPEGGGPEQDALRSEALDEDTLIRSRLWIILNTGKINAKASRSRKKKRTGSL
jgi:hypothetical protein